MNLHSRRDVQQYVKRMHDSHAEMLSAISGGIHTHLVEAATEEELEPSARPCATSASYIKIDIFFLSLYNSAM